MIAKESPFVKKGLYKLGLIQYAHRTTKLISLGDKWPSASVCVNQTSAAVFESSESQLARILLVQRTRE